MAELRTTDEARYRGFTCLTVKEFDEKLLSLVKAKTTGSSRFYRPIDVRLVVTLRYLATCDWLQLAKTVSAFAYFLWTATKYANEPETTLKQFRVVSAFRVSCFSFMFHMCEQLK